MRALPAQMQFLRLAFPSDPQATLFSVWFHSGN